MKQVDEELQLARLLAEEGSPLGASVAALRERGPDATELGLLASRLSLRGVDVATPSKAPAPPKSPRVWQIAGGGGMGALLLWLALRGTSGALAPANDTDAQARALETLRNPVAVNAPERRGPSGPAPSSVLGVAPDAAEPPAAPPAEAVAAPPAAPLAEAPPTLGAREPTPTSPLTRDAAPSSGAARSVTSPGTASSSEGQPSSNPAGTPTEIELLRDARLALRQSPGAALAFAEQHARLYPQGKLTQERELIAISALVATGRRTAALSRGARFEQAFPTSPYRKQLGELLK